MKKFITIALAAVIAISANAKKVNTAVFNCHRVSSTRSGLPDRSGRAGNIQQQKAHPNVPPPPPLNR